MIILIKNKGPQGKKAGGMGTNIQNGISREENCSTAKNMLEQHEGKSSC